MSSKKQEMLRIAEKLGVSIDAVEGEIKHLRLNQLKIVDLLPEMLIMVRSLISSETFSYRRNQIGVMNKGVLISFQNILDKTEKGETFAARNMNNRPHVRITPSHVESEILFPKGMHVQQITILVELEYLKRFVGIDRNKLYYLFNTDKTFWIEEFMSPEMVILVSQLANLSLENVLSEAFYRLKALELMYMLFSNLLNRENTEHANLSKAEINAVYLVRNAIAYSLDKSPSKDELVKLSGMTELKLRKIFTQVFGRGIYEYYNHLRMQEAAKLLKQYNLSVSEVGYKLGFSNLSYFGRLFEKHFGLKPKKWQNEYETKYK
ncbi:helix-turn-helix transcriptional regulator [Chitinophaga sancti]|uniref:AraC-type DNA-binding protein n=1 Tax=Chitinophaga sancti TaxID=1004 RepID=A0A1K1PLN3_9BACT|nr:helix-turn-helix transcriptional regulator [Chitinophaga sancti]WQD59521.1 helix-turn-helix transcriptional regulator [Chitinophaga sancti]WQG88344.1 helix-turn-helix transcriptional regulator [Chitinophaga sancti]SFW48626.1 AraC-type DNA-binding protein [Chitinophaga sancti]